MAQRPLNQGPRSLRALYHLKPRLECFYSTSTNRLPPSQPWPHYSHSTNVIDDQVARLAAKPLHPLTLADLVRCLNDVFSIGFDAPADSLVADGAAHLSLQRRSLTLRILLSPSFQLDSLTVYKLSATSLLSSCQILPSRRFTATTSTPYPHCCRTGNGASQTTKMKFNSQK